VESGGLHFLSAIPLRAREALLTEFGVVLRSAPSSESVYLPGMYPVNISRTTIEIREIEPGDLDAIARIIGAEDVLRYTTWRGPADREAAAGFVRMAREAAASVPRTEYLLAIVDVDSGEVVGTGGIRIEDPGTGLGSLRCLLHPDWWNRGIGTEAARMAVDFGFETLALNRIEADPALENAAASSLLEAAGLKRGDVRPGHHLAPDGQRRDSVAYTVSREDWAARK
jgi:RimJ/RimL family protein N-acetyltransferase